MKKNKKGFTLAELLIVVAIIAVLVAIAIPIFSTQLEKSKEATDIANVRSAYANVMTSYLLDDTKSYTMTVTPKQSKTDWQGATGTVMTQIDGVESEITFSAKTSGVYSVTIQPGDGTNSASLVIN